jgi:triacylglycerol lipase
MVQVVPTILSMLLLFGASIFLIDLFLPGALCTLWFGAVQFLHLIAPKVPSFSRVIYWVRAVSYELLALIGVAFLRLIPMRAKAVGKGRPILLIHGYMNHGSVWRFFKKRLEKLGLGPIYTINLGHPFQSISSYAEKVKAEAELIAKETGRKDLILIGHSMGGLVSLAYGLRLAPPGSITDIITLGSPLLGTPMAWLGLGINAREMRPRSSFLNELQQLIQDNKNIRLYHVATSTDFLVFPIDSALIRHNQCVVFEDIGHATLLYSKRVTQQIGDWLKEGVH